MDRIKSQYPPPAALGTELSLWVTPYGTLETQPPDNQPDAQPVVTLPPVYPEWLGSPSFRKRHGSRFAYVVGEMAGGIAGPALVTAAVLAGCVGFLGAAGLPLNAIADAIRRIRSELGSDQAWGVNIIHDPGAPHAEEALVDLLLDEGVTCASASAFMTQSDALIRYAATGLTRTADGRPQRHNRLVAKVSRPEVARHFLAPPDKARLKALVEAGRLSANEAAIAAELPLASDLTVEADSGGHTDNGSLPVLLASMLQLRESIARESGISEHVCIGAAGGLGTPDAVAGAFAAGADYVVTGSINQATREADTSDRVKTMLCDADIQDVTMAPAADMFELGIQVQVLQRGSVFPGHARRLYQLYTEYGGIQDIPATERDYLERHVFAAQLETIRQQTEEYFAERDPVQNERARRDPHHQLALVLRWYLGRSVRWARRGDDERRAHYQIWCGPSMGAFNRWAAGSFLATPDGRTVGQVAWNIMAGAARITRLMQLRSMGVDLPANAFVVLPQRYRLGQAIHKKNE